MALRRLSRVLAGQRGLGIHNAGVSTARAGMCSSATPSSDESDELRSVVSALGNFLHTQKRLPADVAQAIAGNAPGFAKKVLESFRKSSGEDFTAEKIHGHLVKMKVDKVLLFYESIGMEVDDRDEIKSAMMRDRYQHALAVTAFLEELKVERKTVGNLLDRNKFLFETGSTSDVFNLFQYVHTNGVVGEGLQRLCSQYPEIFTPRIKDDWEPFLQVLRDFGIQEPAMKRLIRHFGFLLMDLPKIDYITSLDFLQLDLNLEKPEVARILKSHPEALLLNLDKMKSKVKFLKNYKVHPADMSRIFARCPSIVGYSVESLTAKIEYLQGLGLRPWNVRQILVSFPAILAHSIENKIKPTVSLLQDSGIQGENLSKLIVKRPAIFGIDNKVKLPDLLDNISYLGPDGMVLALSWGVAEGIRHFKSRLRYLTSLGFSGEEVVKMLSRDPRILKISKEGLETKVKYLTEVMGLSTEALLGNPTYLYSHFERRIKLRYEVLKLLHDRGELSQEPQLTQILYMDNKDFIARYVNPFRPCVTLVRKHYRMFQRKPDGDHRFMIKYLDEPKESSPLPEGGTGSSSSSRMDYG